MSPRERRLAADFEEMRTLVAEAPGVFAFDADGAPPDRYAIEVRTRGLSLGANQSPVLRWEHRFDAYLHLDYPRQAPLLHWTTPIFHPNILPPSRNGGVCIGAWSASESLADLCRRIERMVTYEHIALGDPLNRDAAAWAARHGSGTRVDLAGVVPAPTH